jgi:hypothetical protein
MRGFIRNVGWDAEVREGRLMGTDLGCEPAHLEFPDPPLKERGLRPFRAPEPPHKADHATREKLLDRPHRREICPNPVPEILEGLEVLIRSTTSRASRPCRNAL